MIVCFDVGEVLIDETRVWSVWAEVLGVSPFTLQATIGARLVAGGTHLEALADIDPAWGERVDGFEGRLGGLQGRDLYPDAIPTIGRLRAAGVRVAVAGNQPASRSAQLRDAGVDGDPVITSEELGVAKPDPGFFEAVLEALGAPDRREVWYVGDRRDNDVGPAGRAGLRTVWLRRGPWARLQPAGPGPTPDLVVDDLGTLAEELLAGRRR